MLKFAFVSDAAEREYKDLPADVIDAFGKDLRRIQYNGKPDLDVKQFKGFDVAVKELKIEGSPAYRCVYTTKYLDTLFVLHAFIKTTNGVDRQAMKVVELRLKELEAEIRKLERERKKRS